MKAPIVTGETTLRELGEILERRGAGITLTLERGTTWWADLHCTHAVRSDRDLASAINAALVKAGAR